MKIFLYLIKANTLYPMPNILAIVHGYLESGTCKKYDENVFLISALPTFNIPSLNKIARIDY